MVWRSVRAGVALALLVGLFACSSTRGPGDPTREMSNVSVMGIEGLESPAQREGFALVQVTPDPIEGFNRGSLRFTQWVLDWGIIPLAKVWRFLLPEPVRRSVDNFAYNLSWPGRFVSLLLQGRLVDSGEETGHFLVNTTVGIAGLFDPATRMGIDTFRQDLGLAFASWGFQPGFYLVIPMLGPSSGRDGLGRIFDTALDPATYVTGAGMAFNLNALTFRIDGYESIRETQTNLYLPLRALWSIQRSIEVRDFRIAQEDFASADPEPSLGSLLLRPQEPDFARSGDRRHVRLLASGRDLPYSLWLQDEPAPLLYVIPGIGAHRASNAPVALAELGHAAGYSVAIVSSVFHREFLQAGLEVPYPGNTPRDAEAIHRALSAIHADIEGRRPGHVTSASVMGYSLGAIESLFLAATQDLRHADALRFERFVAINPPVDLMHAAGNLDAYFDAPLRWPEGERDERVLEVGMKSFLVAQHGIEEGQVLPFDRIESEFMVGLAFRKIILDTLAAIEENTGSSLEFVREVDPARGVLAAEVNQSSLEAYAEQLVLPHFLGPDPAPGRREELLHGASLRGITDTLAANPRIRVLHNQDDFLLSEGDLDWLREQLGSRITVFEQGGHLGNLHRPEVQAAILDALGSAVR